MDYKQSAITGSSWQRCRTVTIQNLHPQTPLYPGSPPPVPTAFFQEEQAVSLPDGKFVFTDVGGCSKVFEADTIIPLLDPATGEPTGATTTHGALYQILYSLYMQTAVERDESLELALALALELAP